MAESILDILQNIINLADPIVKSVLSVYRHDEDHAVNQEALCKQTVEYLEKCATFLNITYLNDANKKCIISQD